MMAPDPGSGMPATDHLVDSGPHGEPDRPCRSGHDIDLRLRIDVAHGATEAERIEWVCEDQVRRWQAGQRIPAEAYIALIPALAADGEHAFEVVYGEFVLRESLGEPPSLDEFAWRFPGLADRLRRQLAFHRALAREETETGQEPGPVGVPEEADREPQSAVPGTPAIPGYRILSELGRGGAGVVYKARQLSLGRLVALKVIHPEAHTQEDAISRYRAEAEAVARLQHPNIIQVHEVGEHAGLGYLCLEYASGGSLEAMLAGSPQEPATAAALVEVLAHAIHHTHQCGIVHRDLKPANVVMTEDRVPKITDFGLAKLLEHSPGSTVSGNIVGTPSYMAPEQVLGGTREVVPATDVYALGAILYELLTGRPPFKGATPLSTLDQVAHQEPLVPSRLQRTIPLDLETICLRCLEKLPSRRYASALALAEDLRRFLDGRPILARPAPTWEKAAKWARRHPVMASGLAGLAAAIVIIFAGILYYNARLQASVRTERAAKAEADNNARAAQEQSHLALTALNQLVFEVQERLGETPATRSLRRNLLDTAIAGLDRIVSTAEATPPNLSRAVAHQKLGEIYRELGRSVEAMQQLEQAVQLSERLTAAAPGDLRVKDCLSRALVGLGEIRVGSNEVERALDDFRRVVGLCEEIFDVVPARSGARRGLLESYIRLGRAHGFRRAFDDARAWFRKAVLLADRWTRDEPGSAEAAAMLAWSHRKLADIGKLSGDLDSAVADYQKGIAIGRKSLQAHPLDPATRTHLATALNDLGGVLYARRDLARAGPLYAEAEDLFTQLAEDDPENATTRFMLVHAQVDLARLRRDLGHFSEAAGGFRRAIASLKRIPAGRLSSHPPNPYLQMDLLRRDLAACEAAAARSGARDPRMPAP